MMMQATAEPGARTWQSSPCGPAASDLIAVSRTTPDVLRRIETRLARARRHRDQLLDRWTERYQRRFGDRARLEKASFRGRAAVELERLARATATGRGQEVVVVLRSVAEDLRASDVPYHEAIWMGALLPELATEGTVDACAIERLVTLRTAVCGEVFLAHCLEGGGSDHEVPSLRESELELVQRALRATGGNKLRAARLLGVSRKWLYARLREL